MASIVLSLFIILLIILLLGLYRPWLVLWYVDIKTRLKVLLFFLPPAILLLLIYFFLQDNY